MMAKQNPGSFYTLIKYETSFINGFHFQQILSAFFKVRLFNRKASQWFQPNLNACLSRETYYSIEYTVKV